MSGDKAAPLKTPGLFPVVVDQLASESSPAAPGTGTDGRTVSPAAEAAAASYDRGSFSTPVRSAAEKYTEMNADSERGSTGTIPTSVDSKGQRRMMPRMSMRKSIAWIRNDSMSDDNVSPLPSERSDDTSTYKSFGEGLSRRRSISQLQTARSYALDIETTKADKDGARSSDSGSKPPPHVMYPWTLSNEKITINQDAKINSFSDVNFLCNGKNSHIFKAKSGEEPVVIKKLFSTKADNPTCIHEFKFEVEFLLRAVSCKSIVQVLESGHDDVEIPQEETGEGNDNDDEKKKKKQAEEPAKLVTVPFIVLECLNGGSLTYRLTRKRAFGGRPFSNNVDLYSYMISLAEALNFLHYEFDPAVHVLHRDLKPDNVAFTDDGRLKLIDFGLSICIHRLENATDTYQMTGETGSLRYMAPEVIMSKPYNYKSDVFSFAIVSWEMCTGVVPHAGKSKEAFIKHVVEKKQRPGLLTDPYGGKIVQPDAIKELWKTCWDHDMNKRLTMKEVLEILKEIRENAMTQSTNSTCVCN